MSDNFIDAPEYPDGELDFHPQEEDTVRAQRALDQVVELLSDAGGDSDNAAERLHSLLFTRVSRPPSLSFAVGEATVDMYRDEHGTVHLSSYVGYGVAELTDDDVLTTAADILLPLL